MASAEVAKRPWAVGVGLGCCGAGLVINVVMEVLSLTMDRVPPSRWTAVLLAVVFAAVVFQRTYLGYELALVTLAGLVVFGLVFRGFDIAVSLPAMDTSGIAPAGALVVWALTLLGIAQFLLLLAGAVLLAGRPVRRFVRTVENHRQAGRTGVAAPVVVTRVAVPLYLAAGGALVVQFLVLLVADLPDSRTSFTRWLNRSDFTDFVSWFALLCLTPTLLVLVRRFRTGWLWARTTLTTFGAVIGLGDFLVLTDDSLPLGARITAGAVVVSCATTIVVTYWPSVNDYFRAVRRDPAGPTGPSAPPGPFEPFAPPERS